MLRSMTLTGHTLIILIHFLYEFVSRKLLSDSHSIEWWCQCTTKVFKMSLCDGYWALTEAEIDITTILGSIVSVYILQLGEVRTSNYDETFMLSDADERHMFSWRGRLRQLFLKVCQIPQENSQAPEWLRMQINLNFVLRAFYAHYIEFSMLHCYITDILWLNSS